MTPMGPMAGEVHTVVSEGKPCLACDLMLHQPNAKEFYCDPEREGCSHYHRWGKCPEVRDA